jgi:hypothetical protein
MNNDPCQKEREEFLEATKAWVKAAEVSKRFVVTEPLDPVKDIKPRPPNEVEEMIQAYKREAESRERYFKANATLAECEK